MAWDGLAGVDLLVWTASCSRCCCCAQVIDLFFSFVEDIPFPEDIDEDLFETCFEVRRARVSFDIAVLRHNRRCT